ncbi:hypothetical protein F511_28535 [Dorcoceras hygrometricum]|uniref:Protein FMP32, mitochondrial-like n=1 Tax=Dorcoceras hygrometricum TaxID=472368 RepID=A0A2Z7B3E3_9LAMI|nr:hypothetical protein F511_28535 [Dorcoceras hygrometricum]
MLMAARKRTFQLCIRLPKFQEINAGGLALNRPQPGRFSIKSYSSLSSHSHGYRLDYRQISQLVKPCGKRVFLVDTLALMRSLEAQGVPSKQAEAITSAITEVLDDSLENISQNLISKAEMQKIEMSQEASLSKFKSEIQSSQDHHFSLLQREAEKLRNDIEKMRGELRYEIDKATAGRRLDLNLERGRIRDELNNQETNEPRAHLEAAKYDVIKYCIGTLVSLSAVGIGMIRIFSSKQ